MTMWRGAWVLLTLPSCQPWFTDPAAGRAAGSVEERLTRAVALVAEARERPLDVPAFREVSGEELDDLVRSDYLRHSSAEDRARGVRRGRALGLQGDEDPLEAMLAAGRVAGVWMPEEDRMFVVPGLSAADTDLVWQHELTHALQDRHFEVIPPGIDGWPSDVTAAWRLLLEGEATYVPLVIALGAGVVDWTPLSELGVREPVMGRTVERRSLVGAMRPYVVGPAVIQTLRQHGGWAAVDEKWRSLPLSTEQLLEPDRASDPPRTVALDVQDALPAGWSADPADTFGQQGTFDVFWASLPEAEASVEDAVRGWDGDRIQILANDDQLGFVWRTVWDSTTDAETFAALAASWRPAGRVPTVETRGDEVLITCIDPALLPLIRDAAWRSPFVQVDSMAELLAAHRP